MPGLRVPFHPLALPGVAIPTSRWNAGYSFPWVWRRTCKRAFCAFCATILMTDIPQVYKEWGNETVSLVPFISGWPTIYSSNLDVARQISGGGTKNNFIKPESGHGSLL